MSCSQSSLAHGHEVAASVLCRMNASTGQGIARSTYGPVRTRRARGPNSLWRGPHQPDVQPLTQAHSVLVAQSPVQRWQQPLQQVPQAPLQYEPAQQSYNNNSWQSQNTNESNNDDTSYYQPSSRCRDPAAITARIQHASCLVHLQRLVNQDRKYLNGVHISLLLQKAVQFASTDPSLWFRRTHESRQPGLNFNRPAASYGALASMHSDDYRTSDWGMSDDDVAEPHKNSYLGNYQAGQSRRRGPALSTRGKALALHQLSTVVHKAAVCASQLAERKQLGHVSISCTLSALAKLGYSQQQPLEAIVAACPHTMPDASLQSLCNMIWATAMLRTKPNASWMLAWETAMQRHIHECPSQELCTVMYAMGRISYQPCANFLAAVCTRSTHIVGSARPADIANLCAGFAYMQYNPDPAWMRSFLDATAPRLRYFSLQALQRMISALANLNSRPDPEWMTSFYNSCQDTLPRSMAGENMLSTARVAYMLTSLAQLGARPPVRWLELCLAHARHGFQRCSPDTLVSIMSALATIRYRPADAWMQAFLTTSFQQLGSCRPNQVLGLLGSLSRLNHRPPSIWQQELLQKVQGRLQQYTGDQLSDLIGRLAELGFQPSQEWLAAWERASHNSMEQQSPGSLARAVWALAELNHHPAVGWLYGFVLVAYSKLDAFNSMQLGQVFEALPNISPHPGWLDELVQICASQSSPEWRAQHTSYDEEEEVNATTQLTSQRTSSNDLTSSTIPSSSQDNCVSVSISGGYWSLAGSTNMNGLRSTPAGESSSQPTTLRIYSLNGSDDVLVPGSANQGDNQQPSVNSRDAGLNTTDSAAPQADAAMNSSSPHEAGNEDGNSHVLRATAGSPPQAQVQQAQTPSDPTKNPSEGPADTNDSGSNGIKPKPIPKSNAKVNGWNSHKNALSPFEPELPGALDMLKLQGQPPMDWGGKQRNDSRGGQDVGTLTRPRPLPTYLQPAMLHG